MAAKLSRRQFFRLGMGDVAEGLGKPQTADETAPPPLPLRPPLAIAEANFATTCERCHRCSDACPFDVIEHLGPASGPGEDTPVLDLEKSPCRWCADMPCARACPSGALAFGPEESVPPIGTAVLALSTCLATEGVLCDECAVVCPSEVKAITMEGRMPVLDQTRCVGCGLCAFHCPSTPVSIQTVSHQRRG
jgi:ferredoxin-type protein NapG